MQKNTAGKWVVFAWTTADGLPKTGDANQITANMRIDGAGANAIDDANPVELEDGYYLFDITAAEANGDNLLLCPASSTAGVQVIGVPGAVWTRPANFEKLSVDANGRVDVIKIAGTAQSAGDLKALIDALQDVAGDVHDHEESVIAMLATLSPYFSTGAKFFVSENGNDTTNDGASERPFATIGRAKTECVAGRHDTIIVEQKATPWAEQVVMDKEAVLLLLSGASCKIDPGAAATDDTVKITAANCAVIGAGEIKGRNGHRAVYAYNADGVVIQRSICRTDLTADIDAVVIEECLLPVLGPDLSCSHADGHGLVIKSTIKACHWARITDVTAHQCGGDGIRLEGNVDRAILRDNVSHDNSGYGIYAAGSHNIIDKSNRVHDNVLGQINNVGGLNKVYADETSALAIITGAKNLGVTIWNSFERIVMSQGEKRMIVFEMTEAGAPVDCTGFTFKLGVKGKITDVAYKIAVFNATLSIGTTGLMSLVTWTFIPDMTKSLEPFSGVYETALYDGAGDKVLLTAAAGVSFLVEKALIPVI